jgi:ribosomal protein S21
MEVTMLVKEAMTQDVRWFHPDTPITEVARVMRDEGIGCVPIGENDRLDWALKQFRRRMIRSGLFKDMRRKRFYEKPSEARKAKSKAAQRRRHKDRKASRRAAQF